MESEGNASSSSESDSDEESRWPRIFFLALIMVVSFVLNVFLLHAMLQNKRTRQNAQNITIMNLSAVCLGDCLLNMSLAMGSLAAGSGWHFGRALCQWHAFAMNLVLIETLLLLTVLVCDRFLAIRFHQKYDSFMSSVRLVFVVVFTWIQSLTFSIPYCFNVVDMTFRPELHTCSVSGETLLVFICLESVLCFLAPAVVIVYVFFLIFYHNCKHHHEMKTILTQNHYIDQLMEEPRFWQEMVTVKYVFVLCLLWFILDVPYVITTYIQQYRLSSQLSSNGDYSWGVDVAFVWMRFCFSALFPCATFIWRKDLWQCCKECAFCHRSNSVLDIQVKISSPSKPTSANCLPLKGSSRSKDRDQPRPEPPNQLCFNVPVLFATSEGIHIETPQCNGSDPDFASRKHAQKVRQLDIENQKLDCVKLPFNLFNTSDYDSSIEAECLSCQTISASHITGSIGTTSLPDLHSRDQSERGTSASSSDCATAQGADSGLELSGTADSSKGNSVQRLVNSNSSQTADQDSDHDPVFSNWGGGVLQRHNRHDHPQGNSVNCDLHQIVQSNCCTNCVHASSHDPGLAENGAEIQNFDPPNLLKDRVQQNSLISVKTSTTVKMDSEKEKPIARVHSSGVKNETNQVGRIGRGSEVKFFKDAGTLGNLQDKQSSREERVRGHKRTVTSDSQKALLGSNGSVDLQNLKAVSSESDCKG